MPAIARPGAFERGRNVLCTTRFKIGLCVGSPCVSVEVCCEEPAGIVDQQRICADYEVVSSLPANATQMLLDDIA